jgi:hypothetical protein
VVHLCRLHQTFGDRVQFLFVYVSDSNHDLPLELQRIADAAEPADPWAKRRRIAQAGMKHFRLDFPCVVDTPEREVEKLYYDAYPLRVVVVDREGRAVLDTGRVPYFPLGWEQIGSCLEEQGRSSLAPPPKAGL